MSVYWFYRHEKNITEYYEPLYANNFDNLYENVQILRKTQVIKTDEEEIENPNVPIFIKEFEFVTKIFHTKKAFRDEYH